MRFDPAPALPGWLARQLPFTRQLHVHGEHRVHFVDEGAGRPVLLMHGNPTWCYLWRKVIGPVSKAGFRVVAPDLVGFGLSDKPRSVKAHSLRMHVERIVALVDELDLNELTVVGQDWGGPVAAGVATLRPARVRAAVFANTSVLKPKRPLHTKPFHRLARAPGLSDLLFRGLMFPIPVLGRAQGDPSSIGFEETLAYAYPLRDPRDRAAPVALARMVPHAEGHPSLPMMDRIGAWAEAFAGRTELVWGLKDPILGRALARHREVFAHARVTETQAGHFLQEEVPEAFVQAILRVSR